MGFVEAINQAVINSTYNEAVKMFGGTTNGGKDGNGVGGMAAANDRNNNGSNVNLKQNVGAADPDPQTNSTSGSGSFGLSAPYQLSNITPVSQTGNYDCVYADFEMIDAKYGGNRTQAEIKLIAQEFLFSGASGPSVDQIPYLASLLGFKIDILWDEFIKSSSHNSQRDVFSAIKNDMPVMIVSPNNAGALHDRLINRAELWSDPKTGDHEYRFFVIYPAGGRKYQLPESIFKNSAYLYQIHK